MSNNENNLCEISEDDDSFAEPRSVETWNPRENEDIISISSDNSTSNLTECLTSDEGSPVADNSKSKSKQNEFKENIIRKLFPNSCSTSNNAEVLPAKSKGFVNMISGVPVDMPVKPYGCQIALMYKVITGIKKHENCLLESPTGSGKTLALLCGALAWQKQEIDRASSFYEPADQYFQPEVAAKSCSANNPSQLMDPEKLFVKTKFGKHSIYDVPGSGACSKSLEPQSDVNGESSKLVSIHKRRKMCGSNETSPSAPLTPRKCITPGKDNGSPVVSDGIPKIYYGARTHKQLQQVIKEFKRTAYCGQAKMTILSSREYSCIRPFDKQLFASKNDMCRECCSHKSKDPKTNANKTNCPYYDNRERVGHKEMPPAFDLEDLVQKGHDTNACPYYIARNMVATAHIIFCPYNYLIDPAIRNSMQIKMNNDVVILDEAHNIENICRDSATFSFKIQDFLNAAKELDVVSQYQYANQDIQDDIVFILKALQDWLQWFQNQNVLLDNVPINNKEAVYRWNVDYFVTTLNNHNIGVKTYIEFARCAENFCSKLRDHASKLFGVSQATGTLVESLACALAYLFRENGKCMDDYKPLLVKSITDRYEPVTDSTGYKSSSTEKKESVSVSLRLLCLNPALVFGGLSEARCVLLASGTLAPLVSLHSELGSAFPHRVSPPHVVPAERVWVGTLTTCPSGDPLECRALEYQGRGAEQTAIYDALGDTMLWVCQVTPHGVLCFLPSYAYMNKLIQRWRTTGTWMKLQQQKKLFEESRNVRDHNSVMESYYESVETDKGAMLMAVYRGKVSEGMDFKDQQARAVITVGIPYPNTYDPMVDEKMKYNGRHVKDKNLLNSSEWLRVQAYRALNQAVGRCVRHREDWGAVLLADARYGNPYYTEHLSGWLRNLLGTNHHTYESLVNSDNSLEAFMEKMTLEDRNKIKK